MTGITQAQASRRRTCPQCRRLRFIPLALAPYCTKSCERAAENLRERLADPSLSLCPDGRACPRYDGTAPRHAVRAHRPAEGEVRS
jgi:hypothetical protein